MEDDLKYLEAYYERQQTPQAVRKAVKHELYYAKTLGNGFSRRITIPTCHDDHFESARLCFSKLSKALNLIAKDDLRPQQQLREMCHAIYECHRELKRRADYSRKFPKAPEVDFRNAR